METKVTRIGIQMTGRRYVDYGSMIGQYIGRDYQVYEMMDEPPFLPEPKPVPPTVNGNSRQLMVDNGKRQWPAPKSRRGHK